jgi:hypothetical protein
LPRFPGSKKRIAQALWVVWAILAWNVVFDRVIVLAGREYLTAARLAAAGAYPRMDDWMRPAVTRGVWMASATAVAILVVGFASIRLATRQKSDS